MATGLAKGSALHSWAEIDPKKLRFDTKNPRFVEHTFDTEHEIVQYLYDHADVNELIQSILSAGYLDFEPLIVLRNENIVLEGNRRLAALRLIEDANLRNTLEITLPKIPDSPPLPATVRVLQVEDRDNARAFIGFKHINGPFKWGALAKAQYAADWFRDGGDIEIISRTLGDNHSTVRRLVDGWFALEQAKSEGFDLDYISKRRFAFSHLYTAITRASVRDYLGLRDEDPSAPPKENPVDRKHIDRLLEVMSWLYGQEQRNEPTLVQSQNPHLNQLSKVLGHEEATGMLRATRNLQVAYERVEPPSARFDEALLKTSQFSEEAMKLSAHYQGDLTLLRVAENTGKTIQNLLVIMRQTTNDLTDNAS